MTQGESPARQRPVTPEQHSDGPGGGAHAAPDASISPAGGVIRGSHWMAKVLGAAQVPVREDVTFEPSMGSPEAWARARSATGLPLSSLANLVARHARLRTLDLTSFEIPVINWLPDTLIRKFSALPVGSSKSYLLLAVSNPFDPDLDREFSFACRRSIVLVIAPPSDISAAIWRVYGWTA